MIQFHKIITSVFGIGYIQKGGGTVAAFMACIIWFFGIRFWPIYDALLLTVFITAYGVWGGNIVELVWGKDNRRVVIDEVAGMFVTLLWVPISVENILMGLILFRIFDILKPFYINRLEQLPGGWGVMADDLLAGIYANIILQVIIYLKLW